MDFAATVPVELVSENENPRRQGKELRSSTALYAAIEELGVGPITVKLLRGSDELTVKISVPDDRGISGRTARPAEPSGRGRHSL